MKRMLLLLLGSSDRGMLPSNNPGGAIDVGGGHFPDDLCGRADIGSSERASPPNTPPASGTSTPAAAPGQCSDNDLGVTNGEVASANTLRHVTLSFKNASSQPCTL